MFEFSKIAEKFDEHLSGQLYWHSNFVNHFLPEVASIFMAEKTNCYDFGASTGNVELALSSMINSRSINFIPVEKCKEMAERYKGESTVVIGDFLTVFMNEFSFATCILSLCFVHPSKREDFIDSLKSSCMVGGAFVILEKMKSKAGYLGTALNRVTWRNKIQNGECIEMVVNKELSLSGVQYPLSEKEVEGMELIWAYGDFRAYIWIKEF